MTNTDTLVRFETKDGQTGIGAVSSCSERDINLSIAYNMKPLLRGLLGKEGVIMRITIIPTLYYLFFSGLLVLVFIHLLNLSDPLLNK